MSESDEGEGYSRQAFNHPRPYPFRDYASIRRAICDNALEETRRALAASVWEVERLKRHYESKCSELARVQRLYEQLQDKHNALVLREVTGAGKSSGGRFGQTWGKSLLAKTVSLLRR